MAKETKLGLSKNFQTVIIRLIIFCFNIPRYTEVRFFSFFSGGFITAIVNSPERKLAKRTSVQCHLLFRRELEVGE